MGGIASPATAANNFGSGSSFLYQGQAHVYSVTSDFSAQVYMVPPRDADFDLYARECGTSYGCSCPAASFIMQYPTYSSRNGVGITETLNLPRGTWCVAVFARYGSGAYTISEIFTPTPVPYPTRTPTFVPTIPPVSPGLYKQDIQYGNAVQSQSTIYSYQIGGGRTAIEWYAQPTNCNAYEPPIAMMASESVNSIRQVYPSCNLDLDLYIYKNCDPRYSRCNAMYADTSSGSGAYVGIPRPEVGAKYYAQVFAKRGSGPFRLIARSYTEQDAPIVMMAASSGTLYTAMDISAPV
jgi:hypothetical protein